ncbi:prostatic acid phosphatase [Tribolium castaneum]|uniref:acid phosphatase n=1 Tax=Tribolium castaneum TaxID=7070 RepID=D2A428_TRICA|nr:PREDICTED: prostatic acid phosphatase [Tribolium castaneum]EFA05605.1 Prostatic acid phosphatase-like Protein [Tribolium castaneum]|eukprot:XP_967434.1 PREDICTED: prostatic acid phosphatase [Tribolium castaneum]
MVRLVLVCVLISVSLCDDLISVVVIYRHGDRTPIQPYPRDPYRNASFWPVGFGQLTNLGKQQHFRLGQWLRQRYGGFLSPHYSEKDFSIRSTDVDRTLMSAEANLAGLYPPKADQVWDPALPWQPIPIHTTPELEDNLLSMKKNCPKYNSLLTQLFKTEFFANISRQNRDLYAYLSKNSGANITSLETLEYLYNTLYIESLNKFVLPQWTSGVYPEKMAPWAHLSFATQCYNRDLARLKTGPLFNEIIEHFRNATKKIENFRKFLVFSAHDVTIANVLNTMGAFEYHCPPYASTIMFELRRNSSFYLNVFYKNSSQVQKITPKGCDFNCDFDEFIALLKPIVITRKQWDLECQLSNFERYNHIFVYSSIAIGFLVFTLVLWVIIAWFKHLKNSGNDYTRLAIDEVA